MRTDTVVHLQFSNVQNIRKYQTATQQTHFSSSKYNKTLFSFRGPADPAKGAYNVFPYRILSSRLGSHSLRRLRYFDLGAFGTSVPGQYRHFFTS